MREKLVEYCEKVHSHEVNKLSPSNHKVVEVSATSLLDLSASPQLRPNSIFKTVDLGDRFMTVHLSMSYFPSIALLSTYCLILSALTQAWTPIVVKNVTTLGPQLTPDVTNVSRDGGYSALINGNIVWLYDDTECMDTQGYQLSFVSNTAAYANQPNSNVATVLDFGVVNLGTNPDGSPKTAILAHTTVGTGGWIPFQPDELQYNEQMNGKERVAICKPQSTHKN